MNKVVAVVSSMRSCLMHLKAFEKSSLTIAWSGGKFFTSVFAVYCFSPPYPKHPRPASVAEESGYAALKCSCWHIWLSAFFECGGPHWLVLPHLFERAISLAPKITKFTSLLKASARIKLTKSTRACWRLSSLASCRRSLMCWGVTPSGLPDEPRGKVDSILKTSSLESSKSWKRGLSQGLLVLHRLWAGPWCAFSVSWLACTGVSMEQIILIAALKLPASNLVNTAAASLLLSIDFLVSITLWCRNIGGCHHVFALCSHTAVGNIAQVSL